MSPVLNIFKSLISQPFLYYKTSSVSPWCGCIYDLSLPLGRESTNICLSIFDLDIVT